MREITIVCFNVRISKADDGINSFVHRSGAMLAKLKKENPDIIGFQEVLPDCADFLMNNMPEYYFIYNRRNEDLTGEGLMVAIKKDLFYILGADYFWLSETPNIPATRFADQSGCPRITQCITIQDKKTAKIYRIYNTHLDHIGDVARIKGIKCLLESAAKCNVTAPAPIFLMGDFNALPDSETITYCNKYKEIPITDLTEDIPFTFHNFGKFLPDKAVKIDYIYTNKEFLKNKVSAEIWDDEKDGIFLSDHYPVVVKILL
ncbi:MAG: endonuclease/exonuclease/phosphatase family protein [Ruminococcaceae bacterium]|nr:endonuclease/exonuclease/phosphatase family protein [Oscillospiraceae bacterium]